MGAQLMARKNLFSTEPAQQDKSRSPAKPAVRPPSLGNPLSLMRQDMHSLVREIRSDLIDNSQFADRILGADPALDDLVKSIRENGQFVPALVRPSRGDPKRFEIIYGRRRLAAVRELDIPLKAVIQDFDDQQALMAQGAENNERLDPSFIEKALFAAQLQETETMTHAQISEIICTSPQIISVMLKVVKALGADLIQTIGPCHETGRRPWVALADDAETLGFRGIDISTLPIEGDSDEDRFASLADQTRAMIEDDSPAPQRAPSPASGDAEPEKRRIKFKPRETGLGTAYFERNARSIGIRFSRNDETEAFDRWIENNAEEVLETIKAKWLETQSSTDNGQ